MEDCGATNDDVDMTIMLMQDCIANNGNNETDDDVLFQVLLLGQRTVSVKFLLMRPSSKWTGEHRISNDSFFFQKYARCQQFH